MNSCAPSFRLVYQVGMLEPSPVSQSRMSRRRRTVMSIVGIAAAFWMIWAFGIRASVSEETKPAMKHEQGVGLTVGELQPGEEIVVVRVGHGGAPQEFRFRPGEPTPLVIVSELEWENRAPTKLARVLFARPLTSAEIGGVDAVIDYLRHRPRELRSPFGEYRIEHVRDGAVIGRETLQESALLADWTTHRQRGVNESAIPDRMRELEDRARAERLTLEQMRQWVPFEWLLDDSEQR